MSNVAKYVLAVLIVVGLAEVAPEAVNAFLILLLVGIILMRFQYFQSLVATVGSLTIK